MNEESVYEPEVMENPMAALTKASTPGSTMTFVNPAAAAAAETAKAQIQLAYFMAVQNPRDRREAWNEIMTECGRPGFAEKATYTKPIGGGKKVTGPSIRLAETIIRCWKNILTRTQVIFEDNEKRIILVQVIDVEANTQHSREIVTYKTVERKDKKGRDVRSERLNTEGDMVYVVSATDAEMWNSENSNVSRVLRNESLRLIPADVVDNAVQTALATQRMKDAEDPDDAIKRLIRAFDAVGIKPAELKKYLGHSIDSITPAEIADLRGIYQSLKDGEVTWLEVVKDKDADTPATEATKAKIADLKKELKKTGAAPSEPAPSPAEPTESHGGGPTPTTEPDKWDQWGNAEVVVECGNLAKPSLIDLRKWNELKKSEDYDGIRNLGREIEARS